MPREKQQHPVFRAAGDHAGAEAHSATSADWNDISNTSESHDDGRSGDEDDETSAVSLALAQPTLVAQHAEATLVDDGHDASGAGDADLEPAPAFVIDVIDIDDDDLVDARLVPRMQAPRRSSVNGTARPSRKPVAFGYRTLAGVRLHLTTQSKLLVSDLPAAGIGMLLCEWDVERSAQPLTDPRSDEPTMMQLTAALATPGTCVLVDDCSTFLCSLPHGPHGVRVVGGPFKSLLRASPTLVTALCQLVKADMIRLRAVENAASTAWAACVQVWLQPGAFPAPAALAALTADGGLPYDPVTSMKAPRSSLGVLLRSRLVVDDGNAVAHTRRSTFDAPPQVPSTWDAVEAALLGSGGAVDTPTEQVQVQEADLYAASRPLPGQLHMQADLSPSSDWNVGVQTLLRATLRSYQRRAVRWMAEREQGALAQLHDPSAAMVHPCWGTLHSVDGQRMHVCPATGAITPDSQPISVSINPLCFGGILADSMGLGKTVSTLGLIAATHAGASLPDLCAASPTAVLPSTLLRRIHALSLRVCVPRALAKVQLVDATAVTDAGAAIIRLRLAPSAPPPVTVNPIIVRKRRRVVASSEDDESEMSFGEQEEEDGIGLRAARAREAAARRPTAPPREAVCVCGLPYEAALPLDVAAAVSMFGATHMTSIRNGKRVSKPITATLDPLPWCACAICGEWQHEMCSQRVRDLHSCVGAALPAAAYLGTAAADVADAVICFICQTALLTGGAIASKATVIITPVAIQSQWSAEMQRHLRMAGAPGASPLKVVQYMGVHATLDALQAEATRAVRLIRASSRRTPRAAMDEDSDDYGSDSMDDVYEKPVHTRTRGAAPANSGTLATAAQLVASLSPFGLAAADIVLTTYDVLQNDIHYASNASADFVSVASFIAAQVRDAAPAHAEATLIDHLYAYLRDGCLPQGAALSQALQAGRTMRYEKRFRIVPTPLISVHFMRAVLDEAQMIDTPTANAATMARQIQSLYRWCVSGTPFAKSASDLQALLLFLGWQPYARNDVMLRVIMDSAMAGSSAALEHLLRVTHDVMWRCSVDDVADELDLPPLTQETLTLRMAPIEEAYYRHESSEQVDALQTVLARWSREEHEAAVLLDARVASSSDTLLHTGAQVLSHRERKTVLHPLVRLRQACVHPQLASSSVRLRAKRGGTAAGQKRGTKQSHVVPMEMVLDELIQTALNKCEDDQRTIVSCLNGVAGLLWLDDDVTGALACYEKVREMAERAHDSISGASGPRSSSDSSEASKIRVDPLMRIHAFQNYATLLRSTPGAPVATRNAFITGLERGAQVLEAEFMAPFVADVHRALLALEKAGRAVHNEMASLGVRVADWAQDDAGAAVSSSSRASAGSEVVVALHKNMMSLEEPLDNLLCTTTGQLLHELSVGSLDQRDAVLEAARDVDAANAEDATVSFAGRVRSWNVTSMTALGTKVSKALEELRAARSAATGCLQQLMEPSAADVRKYADCRTCRAFYQCKGPPCCFCTTIRNAFIAYRLQFIVNRTMNTDVEHGDKHLEMDLNAILATKTRKGKKRIIPGAAGDLKAFLKEQGLEADEDDEEAMTEAKQALKKKESEEAAAAAVAEHEQQVELAAAGRGRFDEPTALVRTVRAMGRAVRVLLDVPAALRAAGAPAVAQVDAVVTKLMDLLTSEAKAFVVLLDARMEVLASKHEVEDATMRMQLAAPDEELTPASALFRVHRAAIPERVAELRATQAAATHEFQTHVGALQYLLNLRHSEGSAAAASTDATSASSSSGEVECIVCRDTLGGPSGTVAMLECGHRFCFSHIAEMKRAAMVPEDWGRRELKCPSCRAEFEAADVRKATVAPAPPATSTSSEPAQQPPQKLKASASLSGLAPRVASQRISGAFGTKIDVLVRCILSLRPEGTRPAPPLFAADDSMPMDVDGNGDAAAASSAGGMPQSIVFSQWDDALAICEAALQRNGVTCVRATGAKSVATAAATFTRDSAVSVLLLPFKAGAAGLNITCAQHVFLLEPLLDPALEQQAIGRVYRMGQTRRTYVHRLIVDDTVEPVIAEMNASRLRTTALARVDSSAKTDSAAIDDDAHDRLALHALTHAIMNRGHVEENAHQGGVEDRLVTRGDILALVSRERAYAALISRLGSSVLQSVAASSDAAASVGASAAEPTAADEAAADATEAARVGELVGRNHVFWTQFVDAPFSSTRLIRSVALDRIRAQLSQLTTASGTTVQVFGRPLQPAVAAQLLQLPEATAAPGALGPSPAIVAAIRAEIQSLTARVAEAMAGV